MKRTLLLAGLVAACRKEPVAGTGAQPDSSTELRTSDAAPEAKAPVVGARCRPTGQATSLDDGPGSGELEIGDAVAHADGYAVGILHHAREGRVAAVALLEADAGGARIIDFGSTLGDAPPPRLASCQGTLVAAAFGRSGDLVLYSLDSQAPQHAFALIPQRRDDSLGFDLACSGATGLAVWDETKAASPGASTRGVVRAASFEIGGRAGPAHDVSPPDSDAEMPRVVQNGAGFFVLWLAHRAESTPNSSVGPSPSAGRGGDAGPRDLEATGEARAQGWLEMIALDAAGSVVGPLRRLTATTGHVSAYDVALRFGAPSRAVLVAVRDDEETTDGAGGALLRLLVKPDGVDRSVVLPTDGLGRGPPTFVEGWTLPSRQSAGLSAARERTTNPGREESSPWISWVGPREQMRLLPLDTAAEVVSAPSAEDALDEARPLLWVSGDARMLVAFPGDKAAQLRIFACQR